MGGMEKVGENVSVDCVSFVPNRIAQARIPRDELEYVCVRVKRGKNGDRVKRRWVRKTRGVGMKEASGVKQ